MTTEKQYINKARQNKVELASSSRVKGVTTNTVRSGVAGHGSLSYNSTSKIPKSGPVKTRKDLWK